MWVCFCFLQPVGRTSQHGTQWLHFQLEKNKKISLKQNERVNKGVDKLVYSGQVSKKKVYPGHLLPSLVLSKLLAKKGAMRSKIGKQLIKRIIQG